jgi:hypothetical protein
MHVPALRCAADGWTGPSFTLFLLENKVIKSLAVKRWTIFIAMTLCAVIGFANTAQADDHYAKCTQKFEGPAAQQQAGGGIQKGEGCATQEAMWIWSCYADTSDYTWATDILQFVTNFGHAGKNNYKISGTITSGGLPLAGVTMRDLPGDPVTDASGNYSAACVPAGFHGTVTPTKAGYSFTPANRTYSNVAANYTAQNYTASSSQYVSILGSWTTGTTHAKETGANRALLFVAHAKSCSTSNLTAVTYGGRAMTKITDKIIGSGSSRVYVAAFILNDANITAATTTAFTPTWTKAPSSVTYSSVFLQNVNQTTLTGAFANNGSKSVCSLSTNPLATSSGDMVIENAVSSAAGTYTVTTGWTKDIDLSVNCYDGMDGHRSATGASETPAIAQVSANHALIGYVIKVAPPSVYTLTVSIVGNGSVAKTPDQVSYTSGTVVTLTANPAAGCLFSQWSGDVNGASNPATITMNSNKSVTATFGIQTFSVTGTAGANGSITPTIAVANYNGSQLFTATPDIGYEVNEWFVDGSGVHTGGNTYTLENVTAVHTVAVTFSKITFSISGYVVEIDGNTPVKDVLMSAGDTNTLTDANGYYEFSVGYGWSGVITPEKEGYVFEPNSDIYNNVTQDYNDVNYTAELMTFKITGYVLDFGNSAPMSNTSVSAENGGGPWTSKYGGGSWLTDANGYYEVWVDYNWSGKVTPAKYSYAFEPNNRNYEDVNADYTTGQDYGGTLLTFKVTGYVTNKCGVPIRDVLVSADSGGGQAMTDENGFYEVWVSYDWTGTLTLTKKHYTFELVSGSGRRVMMLVAVATPGQNYTAENIYDLDCDGYIDLGDVGVMADNWLVTGSETPIPGDFDADGTVNFVDFAIFGSVWGD